MQAFVELQEWLSDLQGGTPEALALKQAIKASMEEELSRAKSRQAEDAELEAALAASLDLAGEQRGGSENGGKEHASAPASAPSEAQAPGALPGQSSPIVLVASAEGVKVASQSSGRAPLAPIARPRPPSVRELMAGIQPAAPVAAPPEEEDDGVRGEGVQASAPALASGPMTVSFGKSAGGRLKGMGFSSGDGGAGQLGAVDSKAVRQAAAAALKSQVCGV